jgi:trimeric autotransporter adhesin
MKPSTNLITTTPTRIATSLQVRLSLLIILALGFFALLPRIQAVVPAPDGGYPGGNTAEGQAALLSLSSGRYNTAVGFFSLRSDTEGNFNTGVGAGTLLLNTAPNNTATGAAALLSNTIGEDNTANGAFALFSNTEGDQNTATGFEALFNNTTGDFNTANGTFALFSNTTGNSNTAIGDSALAASTTGNSNTAIGDSALSNNTTGNTNTALGRNAGSSVTTASNVIAIGHQGANVDNSCYIGNIYSNIQPILGTDPDYVTIASDGRLGRSNFNGSSRRFKHDIKPIDNASEVIFALKPVSFRYNKEYDVRQRPSFGLIAEEVAEVVPDLVGRNKKGEPESVRYDQINAMLLNEFLKAHKRVEAQQATITELKSTVAQQQKGMETLTAQLEEQAAQIQKVSAQVEMNKPATRMVLNNP